MDTNSHEWHQGPVHFVICGERYPLHGDRLWGCPRSSAAFLKEDSTAAPPALLLDYAFADGVKDQLGAAVKVELLQNIAAVGLDRVKA